MNMYVSKKWIVAWLAFSWMPVRAIQAQCPESATVWKKIIFLRDSAKLSPKEQLAQLTPYLQQYRKCKEAPDSAFVLLYQRMGWLNVLTGNFQEGRQLTEASIAAYRKSNISMKGDKALLMRGYNNLRLCCDSLGDINASRVARDSSIRAGLRDGGNYTLLSFLLFLQADEYFKLGDYYRTIETADLGYRITNEHAGENLYAAYYLKGFPALTINSLVFLKKFSEAEELLESKIQSLDPSKDKDFLASFTQLYARTLEGRDWKRALSYYQLSFQYYRQTGNSEGCAQTMNNAGYNIFYQKLKDYPGALTYYRNALLYANEAERPNILQNIGNVYMAMKQPDSSALYFRDAYRSILGDLPKKDILSASSSALLNSGYSEYLIDLLLSEAEAYRQRYNLSGNRQELRMALDNYRMTDQFLQKLQHRIGVMLSKLYLRGLGKRLYEPAIELCLQLDDKEQAFYFFEKSRAVILYDQLRDMSVLNPREFSSINQLRKDIRRLELEQDTLRQENPRMDIVKRELFTMRQNEEVLREKLRKQNPLFFQNQLDSGFITLERFRKAFFPANGSFVELLTGDSAVYIMILTGNDLQIKRVPVDSYRSLLARAIQQVSSPEFQNAHFTEFRQTCAGMYELLFGKTNMPAGSMVISADGSYLPFEVLTIAPASGGYRYLIEDHPVSYTYSAAYWYNDFSNPGKPAGPLLGLAPVRFPAQSGLPALVGSDRSLQHIGALWSHSKMMLEPEASRKNFFKQFGRYSIVQLYTHAADSSGRGEPVIWLSDSSIYLSELGSEDRPACRLIVLSACQTGRGQTYIGEGVYSFNRGFAALGVPSAIANLWEADSKSTYLLTEKFYEFLGQGKASDEALRLAKLSLLASNEYSLPYYWAAPVLVGKSESFGREKPWSKAWIYIIPVTIILITGMIFVTRRIRTGTAG